jgi:glycosyltransferase involved in cell wall biosynthesis
MNLGVVAPQVSNYGGSEIYLLECLKRWQRELDVTLYSCSVNRQLLREFGVERKVKVVTLPSALGRRNRYGILEESLILPHVWDQKLQHHDLYFLYLFPTQMIRRRPSVWFAAEPLRMLYDLRHTAYSPGADVEVHFYPKLNYEAVNSLQLDVLLQMIEKIDSSPVCDKWATNSHLMARYLENVYGKTPDLVVHPGVAPLARIAPLPGLKKAISIGRLWKHKRVDLIIKAMALIPEGELLIVGRGPEERYLRRLVRDLSLARRVQFLGDITNQRLERVLAESDCCVYTPISEPFGMVPLEAAAAGRPVIATAGCGFTEILKEPLIQLVPANPEKIAEAIKYIFDHPEEAQRMGDGARRAVTAYSWDRTAKVLLQMFRDTLNETKTSKSEDKIQLGAHYYPWYLTGENVQHWNENAEFASVTDFPLGGPYSSTDPALIRRHLDMAMDAGIDFFVINLQVTFRGFNRTEIAATRKIFQIAEEEDYNLKLSVLLSFDAEEPAVIRQSIEAIREEFTSSPVYQRVQGRPLIWYYLNGPFMGYFFFQHKQLIRLNQGLHPIAAGALVYNKFLPRLIRTFFSGWCVYSPLEIGPAKVRKSLWSKGYRDFHEDGGKIRLFSICPGYDDSRIQSYDRMHNRYRKVPRRGLKTYREMQDFASRLEPTPDLVVITSFNEFHENTHIEPSKRLGGLYLRSTKAFSRRVIKAP